MNSLKLPAMKYPLLQSGFLGLSTAGLTQQKPEAPTFADTILFANRNHEFDDLFYSEDVSKLFGEWQANPHVIQKGEFQHRILEQAMNRFGPSILEWMDFQSNKPAFSQTHKQFLVTMSEWMSSSFEQPSLSSSMLRWVGILGPGQGQTIAMNLNDLPAASDMGVLPNAIINWVSKPAGYESLLVNLYVIFGKRIGHIQRPTM